MKPVPPNPAIRFLARAWASPNTLLGVALGLVNGNLPARFADSLDIHLHRRGPVAHICSRLGIHAFTLGDCVLWNVAPTPRLRIHELRHVTQYRLLGPFFLPLYFVLLLLFGYWNHPLERDARNAVRNSS